MTDRAVPRPAATAPAVDGVAIEARGIVKAFPGVIANDGVDLVVRRGEVHALLGENGAGKSTLASILTGLYRPDAGEVRIGGRPVDLRSPRDGLAHGVGMVHQHFRLVERFTVAENIALGDRRYPRWLSRGRVRAGIAELGERYGLRVDPDAYVGDLSVGEQQRVEIVKTLHRGVDVLLLDEPTAVLTPQETQALFATVCSIVADGKAVLFISHKLGEVMAVSDRVTVLRDGAVSGSVEVKHTDSHELARMMVGREVDLAPQRARRPPGAAVLEVRDLSAGEPGDRQQLHHVSLTVRRGEIVGVAGVAGNGQVELAEAIAGLRRPTGGQIRVGGRDVTGAGPRTARAAGFAYVPEDRLGTGLAPGLSIAENFQLTRPQPFWLDRKAGTARARALMQRFDVRAAGPQVITRTMSGGNVQKVLLARELSDPGSDGAAREPGVDALVVASPTRGLDIGSVEFVRGVLSQRRAAGSGILLLSEDLDEVRSLSDRILVIYEGRIVLERPGATADVTELGLAMAGMGAGSGSGASRAPAQRGGGPGGAAGAG